MPLDTSLVRKPFKVIGTRVRRPDGIDKVTGRAKYGADAFAPGQLVGLVVRSPHAHALIKKIDTSKAEKLPGVKAIVTSADLPDLTGGERGMRDILENCMARKKAIYDGHAVAAIAAVDMHTAKQAAKLIKIDYQVLPHVTEVDEALKPNAPLLHDDIFTDGNQFAPHIQIINIARVIFSVDDGDHTGCQISEIFSSAHARQILILLEITFQGHGASGLVAVDQLLDRAKNALMRGVKEMCGFQKVGDLLDGAVINQ